LAKKLSISMHWRMSVTNIARFGLSSVFTSCKSCNLYAQSLRRLWSTPWTVNFGTASSRDAVRMDFLGLLANASAMRWTFSSDVRAQPPPCLLATDPV
jgi:hypothetical protein